MPQTQLPCPNCGQPVVADVTQLFDIAQDPELKRLFMSGQANMAACQSCGYQDLFIFRWSIMTRKRTSADIFPPELNTPSTSRNK